MLLYGCLYGYNSTDVLERAYLIGYQFEADAETAVVQMMKDVLDNREEHCATTPTTTAAAVDVAEATTTSGAQNQMSRSLGLVLAFTFYRRLLLV